MAGDYRSDFGRFAEAHLRTYHVHNPYDLYQKAAS
jgi:hypothetical protein